MNKQNRYSGKSKHKVDGSVLKPIGAKCGDGRAKSIAGAVAAQPKNQGYAPVEGAVSGKKKF